MTGPGERSALDPDLVPIHQRIRALLLRHPDSPIPDDAVKALRADAARPRPGSRRLVPERSERDQATRAADRDAWRAAKAVVRSMIQSAIPATVDNLDRLSRELRGVKDHLSLRFYRKELNLDLEPETARTIARHLLRQGVTTLEIMTGLHLLTAVATDEDIELISEIALLQANFGYAASEILKTCSNPGQSLYWLVVRSSQRDQDMYTQALGTLSTENVEPLLARLKPAELLGLLRNLSRQTRTPAWIKGSRRFTTALSYAAAQPEQFGTDLAGLKTIVEIRNDLLYGHSALADIEPGLRAAIVRDLLNGLRTDNARALVSAALTLDPHDSEAIWLHQYIERADDGDGDFPPGLAIRISVPAPSTYGSPRTHVLIDGVPLVTRLFDLGVPDTPTRVLHRDQGLRAGTEPHTVWLAEAECTEGCCGVLAAHIRRDADTNRVLWQVKRTRSRSESVQLTFDADAYDAEVTRAASDHSWEWPAMRAARILDQRLRDEPAILARWNYRSDGAASWNSARSTLRLRLTHLEPPTPDQRPLHFEHKTEIPDTPTLDPTTISTHVEAITNTLRTTNPKPPD